ncbi:MAG: MBL fold metallo-hydrolase [Actinobacteria bacterium]|nr:MBL fold metallo-hydrolase [Actinomycetota bacterium]
MGATKANPTIEEIRDGIYRIRIEVPFEVGSVSIYLIDFPPLILVDSGPIMPGLYEGILSAIKEVGLDPGSIERLIVTHGHIDHHGLARHFREGLGLEVWVHREDAWRVSDFESSIKDTFDFYVELMLRWGIPEELASGLSAVSAGFASVARSCPVDRQLMGGEVVEGSRHRARVWHCPGHAAGQIVLELESEGLLITGDHLLPGITPNPEIYFPSRGGKISGLADYIDSLGIIESLEGELALPGHEEPFAEPARRAAEIKMHHGLRADRVVEIVSDGAKNLWDVTLELFREEVSSGDELQLFLSLKETVGHLEILIENGRIEEDILGIRTG